MVVSARVTVLAVTALLLAGTGVGVTLTRDGDRKVVAAAVDETTMSTSATVLATTSTVTAIPATTTTVASPTTSVRRTTTTVARATTTRPPAATTTTRVVVPACTPTQLKGTVVTDKPSYGAGGEVRATSTLRNQSPATCSYNGYGFTAAFKDAAGATLIAQSLIADSFADVPLRPGEAITSSGSWDQRVCPEPSCNRASPNPYTVAATWKVGESTYEFTTTFILS